MTDSAAPADTTSIPRLRAAYVRRLEEITAVPDSDVIIITIDIPTAVTTVLGALPSIRAFRDRIARLPEFDLETFDKLENYALALAHAQARHTIASTPPKSLPDLSARVTEFRSRLHTDASTLAARGLVDGRRPKELKGPNGYRNVSFDVEGLATLLRDSWRNIEGKTAVTLAELDEAETLVDQLLTAVGVRDQARAATREAADIRNRAYSLFFNAYDEVRRALTYLRWKSRDVDDIAPSLFLARATSRRPATHDDGPEAPIAEADPAEAAKPESDVRRLDQYSAT